MTRWRGLTPRYVASFWFRSADARLAAPEEGVPPPPRDFADYDALARHLASRGTGAQSRAVRPCETWRKSSRSPALRAAAPAVYGDVYRAAAVAAARDPVVRDALLRTHEAARGRSREATPPLLGREATFAESSSETEPPPPSAQAAAAATRTYGAAAMRELAARRRAVDAAGEVCASDDEDDDDDTPWDRRLE